MATLAQLRSRTRRLEARLHWQRVRLRWALTVLENAYRSNPAPPLAAALGLGWVSAFWLTPAGLVAGAARLAIDRTRLVGRRALRRALL